MGLMWSGEMLRVGLGGDLHDQVAHAVVGGLAHHPERIQRLRRRQVGLLVGMAVQAVVHGGEQRAAAARMGVEDRLRQVGGGGFAFGAGDADDGQFVLRASVELRRQQAERLARVVHDQSRGAGGGRIIGVGHVGGQPPPIQTVQIFRPEPPLADEQRTAAHGARVVGDGGERHVGRRIIGGLHHPTVIVDDLPEQAMVG